MTSFTFVVVPNSKPTLYILSHAICMYTVNRYIYSYIYIEGFKLLNKLAASLPILCTCIYNYFIYSYYKQINISRNMDPSHTQRCLSLNLAKSKQNFIVITLFRMILHQTKFCLVQNQTEKCNYNASLVCFSKIQR